MDIIYSIIYCMVGIILAYYWYKKGYESEYNELAKTGEVQSSMASLLLLFMTVLWPIKVVYNLIKHHKV